MGIAHAFCLAADVNVPAAVSALPGENFQAPKSWTEKAYHAGRGPDLDTLVASCKRRKVRAFYTMPTLHNPLGWGMGATRRRELAAIARCHGLMLIEDAAYAFLVNDAPPPLAALAPELTVYVSSLSRSVATGLRIGFLHAPAEWIPKLERAIRATTWIPLEQEVRADTIAMALMRERIPVTTALPFSTSSTVPHAIRLAIGSVDLSTLKRSLETVASVIAAHTY